MLTAAIIGGFLLGITSSLHCVGMCGPLSLALPVQHMSKAGRVGAILLYQVGRVLTYSILGLVMGLAGRSFWLSGYQQTFSIVAGSLIILMALFYFLQKKHIEIPFLSHWYRFVQSLIIRVMQSQRGLAGFLLLGMANGLLPCGMVYLAAAASLSFSKVMLSVSFMAAFGAGTMPAMLLVAFGGRMFGWKGRSIARKLVPVFIVATGLLLIMRGFNLGIPFISPQYLPGSGAAVNCHP